MMQACAETRKPMMLRPKQIEHVDHVISAILRGKDIAVIAPTGYGKSHVILAAVTQLLAVGYKVTVAVPSINILSSIVDKANIYGSILYDQNSIALNHRIIDHVDPSRIREYLKKTASHVEMYAPICTNAALIKLIDSLPDSLVGHILFVDEAQITKAKVTKRFIEAWRSRGGLLVYSTATPYRADSQQIIYPDMEVSYLSLIEHMRSGDAPSRIMSEIVACYSTDELTAENFVGENPSKAQSRSIAKNMAKKWKADGCPKFIIYYPSRSHSTSNEYLRIQIKKEFGKLGAKSILDVTGKNNDYLQALKTERGLLHSESKYDGVIGCGRVREGFDWFHSCATYCVGMPGSLPLIIQLLGRALRKKELLMDGKFNPYHPKERANVAEISFFIPVSGSERHLKKLEKIHSWNALSVCCFLADHEIGQRYVVLGSIKNGLSELSGKSSKEEKILIENEISKIGVKLDSMSKVDVDKRNSMIAWMQIIKNETEQSGVPFTNETLETELINKGIPEVDAKQFVTENVIGSNKFAAKRFEKEISQRALSGFNIDDSLKEAYEAVLHAFRKETVDQTMLKTIGRHVINVSAETMQDFANRLTSSEFVPYSEAKRIVQDAGIKTMTEYLDYREILGSDKKLPVKPGMIYENEWIDWDDFLNRQKKIPFVPYLEAKRIVQEAGIKMYKEYLKYRDFYRNDIKLPSQPSSVYGNEWVDWDDFLNKTKKTPFVPYLEAKQIIKEVGIKTQTEYEKYRKKLEGSIKLPSNPNTTYKNEWIGWDSFLGKTK